MNTAEKNINLVSKNKKMRYKFKDVPLVIDVLVIIYLCVALWFIYKGDLFGYDKILTLFPQSWQSEPPLWLRYLVSIRFYLFSFIFLIISIELYLLKKWVFFATLFLNVFTLLVAPFWAKAFTLATMIYLIMQREYFSIGGFKRPELKEIIHVDYNADDDSLQRIDIDKQPDRKVENFIKKNDFEQAIQYTRGMINVAKSVGDKKKVIYYEKYLHKINKIKNRIIR